MGLELTHFCGSTQLFLHQMIQSNTQLKKQSNLKLTEPNNFNDISFTT